MRTCALFVSELSESELETLLSQSGAIVIRGPGDQYFLRDRNDFAAAVCALTQSFILSVHISDCTLSVASFSNGACMHR